MCKIEIEKFSTFSKCREMCSTCAKIPYLVSIKIELLLYGAFIYQHFSEYDNWLPDPTYCSMSALCCDSTCGYKYSGKLGLSSDEPVSIRQRHFPAHRLCFHMTDHIIALSPWTLQIQYSSLSVHALNTLSLHTKRTVIFPPCPHSVKMVEFLFLFCIPFFRCHKTNTNNTTSIQIPVPFLFGDFFVWHLTPQFNP